MSFPFEVIIGRFGNAEIKKTYSFVIYPCDEFVLMVGAKHPDCIMPSNRVTPSGCFAPTEWIIVYGPLGTMGMYSLKVCCVTVTVMLSESVAVPSETTTLKVNVAGPWS